MTLLLITAVVVLLDQATKLLIMRTMVIHQSIAVIPSVFNITYVHNYGAAFGIFAHRTGLFVLITVAVVVLILLYLRHVPQENRLMRFALALQLAGALGNLIDRVRFGYVVDFLELRFWPVFNVADMAIVFGIGLLMLDLARAPQEKGI